MVLQQLQHCLVLGWAYVRCEQFSQKVCWAGMVLHGAGCGWMSTCADGDGVLDCFGGVKIVCKGDLGTGWC